MIRFDLRKYRRSGDVFFECGTGGGAGVRAALDAGFREVVSVELSEKHYREALAKFPDEIDCGAVCLVNCASVEAMHLYLWGIPGRTVWWLDAHIDHPHLPGVKTRCPLLEELDLLAKWGRCRDTILVDDRRLFDGDGWGKGVTEAAVRAAMERVTGVPPVLEDNFIPGDVLVSERAV